jgi:hypothetical protein
MKKTFQLSVVIRVVLAKTEVDLVFEERGSAFPF